MERENYIGSNRTGISAAPQLAKAMIEGAEQYSPEAEPSEGNDAFAFIEGQYISDANSVGSMPPPGTMKGVAKTLLKKMTGRNAEVFLNKLGERLAYERTGVRLYESFIRKCEALMNGSAESMLPMDELWQIRNEEEQHFLLLQECIQELGADPTAQTPDADVSGVASMGIMQVITDPRTSIAQCLECLLTIELTDNAAWELLIALSDEMNLKDMSERFQAALQQEMTHLVRVRTWYENAVTGEITIGGDDSLA